MGFSLTCGEDCWGHHDCVGVPCDVRHRQSPVAFDEEEVMEEMNRVVLDEVGCPVHEDCGGSVFLLETGFYWCMSCDALWWPCDDENDGGRYGTETVG